jgi:hypothetical protein
MPDQTVTDIAVEHARSDAQDIAQRLVGSMPGECIVDGSMYSPSWRALDGGAAVWAIESEDVTDVYNDELDRRVDDLPVMWEDGCLFVHPDESEEA